MLVTLPGLFDIQFIVGKDPGFVRTVRATVHIFELDGGFLRPVRPVVFQTFFHKMPLCVRLEGIALPFLLFFRSFRVWREDDADSLDTLSF